MSEQISTTEVANLESSVTPPSPESVTPPAVTVPSTPELYDVKVNGQTFKVPLDELRNGYQRQQDYTKKTMEYSTFRSEYDKKVQGYENQLTKVKEFFADPRVQTALAQLNAGVSDPSSPLTAEQAQQLYASQAEKLRAEQETRFEQHAQELEVKTLTNQYTSAIDSTIKAAIDKFDILKDVDGIEMLLKRDVAAREPANLEEAQKLFAEVAEARANKIMGRIQQLQKTDAINKAKLVSGGIEPPGGGAPSMPAGKLPALGSKELFQAALDDYTKGSTRA